MITKGLYIFLAVSGNSSGKNRSLPPPVQLSDYRLVRAYFSPKHLMAGRCGLSTVTRFSLLGGSRGYVARAILWHSIAFSAGNRFAFTSVSQVFCDFFSDFSTVFQGKRDPYAGSGIAPVFALDAATTSVNKRLQFLQENDIVIIITYNK
jgi:hypothetical protein